MTEVETAWLAGLLEGEGTFAFYRRDRNSSLSARLKMTDPDVVAKAARLTGRTVSQAKVANDWKPAYVVTWTGAEAAVLMWAILPHMGERRTDKILTALADWYEHRMMICKTCEREFSRSSKAGRTLHCPQCRAIRESGA